MARFRKKPVEIEAVRFNGACFEESPTWLKDALAGGSVNTVDGVPLIPTLEGTMTMSAGDYIIRGVAGELYPCKPDIFAQTYEAVT